MGLSCHVLGTVIAVLLATYCGLPGVLKAQAYLRPQLPATAALLHSSGALPGVQYPT